MLLLRVLRQYCKRFAVINSLILTRSEWEANIKLSTYGLLLQTWLGTKVFNMESSAHCFASILLAKAAHFCLGLATHHSKIL